LGQNLDMVICRWLYREMGELEECFKEKKLADRSICRAPAFEVPHDAVCGILHRLGTECDPPVKCFRASYQSDYAESNRDY
jgi:hypothetical protein